MKAVKTLGIKTILGQTIPVGGGEYIGKVVAAVTGIADGWFSKMTNYGESIALTGEFIAVNLETGETFEGSQIYLPDEFARKVAKTLDASEGGVVTFEEPIQIEVAGSEKAARGYTFVVRKLQTLEAVNRKAKMAEAMLQKVAALPKPEKTEETTEAKKQQKKSA